MTNVKFNLPGLLDRPVLAPPWNLGEFEYKIFISGRSGVGKTSIAARLSANEVPRTHGETPGSHISTDGSSFTNGDVNCSLFLLQVFRHLQCIGQL